jgi:hypothetical protein
MLICFFNIRSAIHFEFVPEGTAVNQTTYVEVLKSRIVAVRRKRGELWRDCSLILQHDSAEARSLYQKESLPWIIRCTLRAWLQLPSGCFQNSRMC